MTALTPPGSSQPSLTRRQILAGGAVAAVGATAIGRVVLGGSDLPRSLVALARRDGPSLSIGFVDQVLAADQPVLVGRPEVVPAASLPAGGLGSRAVASISGTTPGALEDLPLAGLHLDALFPPVEGDDPLRFAAWTYRAEPQAISPPVRFSAPVRSMSLGFGLTLLDQEGEERTSVLTGGSEEALPGMRPGTYLLGFAPDQWASRDRLPAADDPAWSRLGSVMVTLTEGG